MLKNILHRWWTTETWSFRPSAPATTSRRSTHRWALSSSSLCSSWSPPSSDVPLYRGERAGKNSVSGCSRASRYSQPFLLAMHTTDIEKDVTGLGQWTWTGHEIIGYDMLEHELTKYQVTFWRKHDPTWLIQNKLGHDNTKHDIYMTHGTIFETNITETYLALKPEPREQFCCISCVRGRAGYLAMSYISFCTRLTHWAKVGMISIWEAGGACSKTCEKKKPLLNSGRETRSFSSQLGPQIRLQSEASV